MGCIIQKCCRNEELEDVGPYFDIPIAPQSNIVNQQIAQKDLRILTLEKKVENLTRINLKLNNKLFQLGGGRS
uniref:Uncharacterized protein n=1 Tax=viral metagenome TaxID=1070528 RepID=A0A6C0CLW9_9ZZZZ